MEISPIAYFHSPFGSKFGIPRQSGLVQELTGEIRFTPEFSSPDAIKGLEGFSRLWIIWGFNEKSTNLTVRPPRLGGNTRLGVFATRSPFRPNALGLSCVEISSISSGVITVKGADLMDGTAIYDIKPYVPYADAFPDAAGGFTDSNDWNTLQVVFPEELRSLFSVDEASALEHSLRLDPRPRYQDDPQKIYGLLFADRNVKFSVSNGILTVLEVEC